jgi:beta-lactamase superfamily II metal-dependent hydrolase
MYEVDFLPVGDGERSGDAIALRYQAPNPANGDWVVVVIDGGFSDDGPALVDHVQRWYRTSRVDLVVNTHPDGDHVGGLSHVLEHLEVGELLVHDPRAHLTDTSDLALDTVLGLIDLADELGVPRTEPLAGLHRFDGTFLICGPSRAYYQQLLDEQLAGVGRQQSLATSVKSALAASGQWLRALASRPAERLTDNGVTSPRNNTSVICQIMADGRRLLFTGDAGQPALTHAAELLEACGYTPHDWPLTLVQAPHHGSRRNVGPTILNRILGPHSEETIGSCLVSAGHDAARHPNPLVVNAFALRGYAVYPTNGRTINDSSEPISRPGWGPVDPLGFVDDSAETDEDS